MGGSLVSARKQRDYEDWHQERSLIYTTKLFLYLHLFIVQAKIMQL
jgi:hypothetical protein